MRRVLKIFICFLLISNPFSVNAEQQISIHREKNRTTIIALQGSVIKQRVISQKVPLKLISRLPTGAQFNRHTGKFIWIPRTDQIGLFHARFRVKKRLILLNILVESAETNATPTPQQPQEPLATIPPPPTVEPTPTQNISGISFLTPLNNEVIQGLIPIAVTSDAIRYGSVQYLIDGSPDPGNLIPISVNTSSIYRYNWNTTNVSSGTHTIQAKGFVTIDGIRRFFLSDPITVWVESTCPDLSADTINANDVFGLVGDGITDNYQSFRKMTRCFSRNFAKRKKLVIAPGTYKLDAYINAKKGGDIYNANPTFQNCSNIDIIGNGATVSVKGDIFRTADHQSGTRANLYYSDVTQLSPFTFNNCSDFSIKGFNLIGNVGEMTRATVLNGNTIEVAEGPTAGIRTSNSTNYAISNIEASFFASDGLYIGSSIVHKDDAGKTVVPFDEHVVLQNINAHHNARCGFVIISLAHADIIDSEFSKNGDEPGSYGSHSPRCGVDLETVFSHELSGKLVDDITFENVKFHRNKGVNFSAVLPAEIKGVTINNSSIIADPHGEPGIMTTGIQNMLISNSLIDTEHGVFNAGYFDARWPTESPERTAPQSLTIFKSSIISKSNGLISKFPNVSLTIDDTLFEGSHDAPYTSYMPYISDGHVTIRNSRFFFPKTAYNPYSPSRNLYFHFISLLSGVDISENNSFSSNLDADISGKQFVVLYGKETKAINDAYPVNKIVSPVVGYNWSNPYNKLPQ